MNTERGKSAGARAFWAVFLAALVLRLLAIPATSAAEEARGMVPWDFGHEAACTAQSWIEHGVFGDPWGRGTGASGWIAPPYPLLVATCLRLGGGIGPSAAWLLFSAQAVLGALAAALLVPLGRALFDHAVGRLAGWMLALHPFAIYYTTAVWDTTLSLLAVVLVLFAAVRLAPRRSRRAALLSGLVLGGAALANPACLALLPVVVVLHLTDRSWLAGLQRLAWVVVGAALVCAPWMLRNERVLGSAGLRTNFGVELRVGNGDGGSGRHETDRHPSHSPRELARYREMGEVPYVAWARDQAVAWMRANPGEFLRLSLRRVFQFWFGEPPISDTREEAGRPAVEDPRAWVKWVVHASLGIVTLLALAQIRRRRGVRVLAWVLLAFPLPYYVTHVSERYRLPIEPVILLLVASAGVGWLRRDGTSGEARDSAGGGAMLRS